MNDSTQANKIRRARGEARYLTLLISLLLLFVITPFVETLRYGLVLMSIAVATVIVSGTYAVSERRHLFVVTLIVAAATVATTCLLLVLQREWIVVASDGLLLLLLGLFSVGILGDVLRRGRISANKIYGAICVYLLIGAAWGFAYVILELINPGSFSGLVDTGNFDYAGRAMQMRYFSFATLTTLGFGDILPRSPVARTLSMLEAVMGQIYLTVLIARLVGLHIVQASSRGDD
jgi:voltage-gated potassium channel